MVSRKPPSWKPLVNQICKFVIEQGQQIIDHYMQKTEKIDFTAPLAAGRRTRYFENLCKSCQHFEMKEGQYSVSSDVANLMCSELVFVAELLLKAIGGKGAAGPNAWLLEQLSEVIHAGGLPVLEEGTALYLRSQTEIDGLIEIHQQYSALQLRAADNKEPHSVDKAAAATRQHTAVDQAAAAFCITVSHLENILQSDSKFQVNLDISTVKHAWELAQPLLGDAAPNQFDEVLTILTNVIRTNNVSVKCSLQHSVASSCEQLVQTVQHSITSRAARALAALDKAAAAFGAASPAAAAVPGMYVSCPRQYGTNVAAIVKRVLTRNDTHAFCFVRINGYRADSLMQVVLNPSNQLGNCFHIMATSHTALTAELAMGGIVDLQATRLCGEASPLEQSQSRRITTGSPASNDGTPNYISLDRLTMLGELSRCALCSLASVASHTHIAPAAAQRKWRIDVLNQSMQSLYTQQIDSCINVQQISSRWSTRRLTAQQTTAYVNVAFRNMLNGLEIVIGKANCHAAREPAFALSIRDLSLYWCFKALTSITKCTERMSSLFDHAEGEALDATITELIESFAATTLDQFQIFCEELSQKVQLVEHGLAKLQRPPFIKDNSEATNTYNPDAKHSEAVQLAIAVLGSSD